VGEKRRKRKGRRKKVVRKTPRCPNCNSKLKRTGVPGRYLCVKCDVFWTVVALRAVTKERAKQKELLKAKAKQA
jgi:tRNA(Ile2) C34 agmatinyltransferase TiaS